jgi:uncharacterized repeat protein (TIGR01451 family)
MKNSGDAFKAFRWLLRTSLTFIVLIAMSVSLVFSAPAAAGGSAPPSAPAPEGGDEYVKTFDEDCATPKTIFVQGDTVCAESGLFPLPLFSRYRRFQWVTPNGFVAELTPLKVDPQFDKFVIPSTGDFAKLGTWTVRSIGVSANVYTEASFKVRHRFFTFADLWLTKFGPAQVGPGERVKYSVMISSPGPDDASDVEFVDDVPTNMVFVGMRQLSGPAFDCVTPKEGDTGRTTCAARSMAMDEIAEFELYYQVNLEAREGTACTSTAQVSSSTDDLNRQDNLSQTEVTVFSPE